MVKIYKIQDKANTYNSAHTLLKTFIQNFKYAEEKNKNKNKFLQLVERLSVSAISILYKNGNV